MTISFNDGITNHAKRMGIDTNRELQIWLHTDEASRKLYEDLSRDDSTLQRNSFTTYYFTKDGDYKKSSTIHSHMKHLMDKSRIPLYPSSQVGANQMKTYESEMLAGDFEIAGKALQMLINRLTPLVENKE